MLLCADGRLDNKGVEGVRNQGNSKVGLLESLVQSSGIVHIEGNSLGVGETLAELLGTLKGSAGNSDMHISLGENLNSGLGDEARAQKKDLGTSNLLDHFGD